MEYSVKEGIVSIKTQIVKLKDTASTIGSGLAEVFATPALITLMENTAYKSIEPFLPEGYSSVGVEINVQHLKASLPGTILSCESVVSKVEGKKVYFTIKVSDNDSIVGKAEHIRYIINSEKFMKNLHSPR